MIYTFFILSFIVSGIIISNWINNKFVLALGIPDINSSLSIATTPNIGFTTSLSKTLSYFSKVFVWLAAIILPVISLTIIILKTIKKFITK